MLSLLAACAGHQAYTDGQAMLGAGHTQQGLALLEQAAQPASRDSMGSRVKIVRGARRFN